jgi:F-type H+-transporting ATPase subunit b
VNVTATLIAQLAAFGVLVWFVMNFLWGPITRLMEERKTRIADGLAAGERGRREQELAEKRAKTVVQEAKGQAAEIVSQAQKRATEIIEEGKAQAREEGNRLLQASRAEIEHETTRAREQLRQQVASLAVAGAEKILQREVDPQEHQKILEGLVKQL